VVGPLVGGMLIAMKTPLQELFLWASLPMLVGVVAAVLVARLCYVRFRGFQLDDKPAEPEAPGGVSSAKVEPLTR
ncbi:MAG TPA: hypothetical protein VGO53_05265, partial [Steroidobacteraceae bacterium]|nr:hypothetical protein [Steroidobacteraceae bacterium]